MEEENHEGWRANIDEGQGSDKQGWVLLRQVRRQRMTVLLRVRNYSTSLYGSSCAKNGKGALTTPEGALNTPVHGIQYTVRCHSTWEHCVRGLQGIMKRLCNMFVGAKRKEEVKGSSSNTNEATTSFIELYPGQNCTLD
eukprot:5572889-Pyramimonas_sp.AAC.1